MLNCCWNADRAEELVNVFIVGMSSQGTPKICKILLRWWCPDIFSFQTCKNHWNVFSAAVLSIKMSWWNRTVSLPILQQNHGRAAFLSKKTQSNFLLRLLFTCSEDNNSFFSQSRAFLLSLCPSVCSDSWCSAWRIAGTETRHGDLENFFSVGFPPENRLLCHYI